MANQKEKDKFPKGRIRVEAGGPYKVEGGIPFVRKIQVVSEYGEPLNWKKEADIPTKENYDLCRCGKSKEFPFCDTTHCDIDFEGKENAPTNTFKDRAKVDTRGTGIVVKDDFSICMDSGFCGNRLTKIRKMVPNTAEPAIRAEIMAMIDRCPSGTYAYSLDTEGEDIEADLPAQIAQTIEITSEGPIEGPFWVTGYVPVERADKKYFEVRNRVTLCNCGASKIQPLCDGTHRKNQEAELKKKKEAK
jgi:CDGSH-type Zn-finger protein